MRILLTLSVCLVGLALSARAQISEESLMRIGFDTPQSRSAWVAVNDGVMGGRSSGGPDFNSARLIFSGEINTNGGGFSSIRRGIGGPDTPDTTGVTYAKIRIKTDGRDYKLRFRTDARYFGRRISFQKTIPVTEAGVWETVTLKLDNMHASLFGRAINGAVFDASKIREIGFILADGQDGAFEMEVDSIDLG